MPIPLALLLTFTLASAYTNCAFRIKAYEPVCRAAVKNGASVDYANRFLLSDQTKARDLKSLQLLAPEMIATHQRSEKRATNALLSYVPTIAAHLRTHTKVYDEAQRRYGVNREVVAAILAKETRLGTYALRHDAFTVFNTLLRELEPDSARNRRLIALSVRNLAAIIEHCASTEQEVATCRFASSYAGAVGIPQFLPQNFRYVVGHARSHGDLARMEDAILSCARYLNEHSGFTVPIDWKRLGDMAKIEQAWYDYDATHFNASFAYAEGPKSGKAYDCYGCGKPELAYLLPYVRAVMDYNLSSHYALGVLRLAFEAHRLLQSSSSSSVIDTRSLNDEMSRPAS